VLPENISLCDDINPHCDSSAFLGSMLQPVLNIKFLDYGVFSGIFATK
jgi:hypothetical protein